MYNMTYRHCIVEGNPYEAGYELGMQLANEKKLIKELTSPHFGEPLPQREVENTAVLFERYIPCVNEEIKGFSDATGVSYLNMVIYSSYLNIPGGCSHFAVVQNDTGQKRMYHARNYDYSFDETPILITVRISGKNNSTGFGCKIFGHFDGMNNKGLCVTTSAADVNHTGAVGNGFVFPMIVRAMLDQCSTAYDAKEMLLEIPCAEYRNFLISDKAGTVILVEASPKKKSYRCIGVDDKEGFLCSSNHFTLEQSSNIVPVQHSIIRQQKMEETLTHIKSKISLDDVKDLLSKQYPEGLAFSYYQGGMGTLWSTIFEPISLSQYICYGSPESGVWSLVNPNEESGCKEMTVSLVDANVPKDFWK